MTHLSRRSVLIGLAALAGLGSGPASGQVPLSFASVSVDVSHLRAIGLGPTADLVGAVMADELRRVFADRITGRGPRLVVRPIGLHINPFPSSPGFRGGSDSIDGEALVVGPRGEILARYPQLAALASQGSSLDPNEAGRAVAVARHYARWLRRTIG